MIWIVFSLLGAVWVALCAVVSRPGASYVGQPYSAVTIAARQAIRTARVFERSMGEMAVSLAAAAPALLAFSDAVRRLGKSVGQ